MSEGYGKLTEHMKQKGIPSQVIGDANKIGLVFDAIHQGFEAERHV